MEVVTQSRDVIARGVAETHREGRSDAEKAASRTQPDVQEVALPACRRGQDTGGL
jgi:hypothetical protein